MTAPTLDPPPVTDPFAFGSVPITDVPPLDPPIVPDHTASGDDTHVPPPDPPESGGRGRSRDSRRPRTPRADKGTTPRKTRGAFVKPLTQLYSTIGVAIMPFDNVCGAAVIRTAPSCAQALDDLAYQNDAVRRALTTMLETTTWGAVIVAHTPILLAILVHHVPAIRDNMGSLAQTFGAPSAEGSPDGTT